MAITALDIQQQMFSRGAKNESTYKAQEVDEFLERLAVEVDTFNRALVEARSRYEAAEARAQAAERELAQAQASLSSLKSQGQTKDSSAAATEEQISRAFIAAQRSADALTAEAKEKADASYREAEARARDIVRDALAEKQRIISEVDRLRASCEKFRSDYLSLLNHFSADAQKVMPSIDDFTPNLSADYLSSKAKAMLAENDASVATNNAGSGSAFAASNVGSAVGLGNSNSLKPTVNQDASSVNYASDAKGLKTSGSQQSSLATTGVSATNASSAVSASQQSYRTSQPHSNTDFLDDLDIEEID
ncbi:MAG: DivIVA domain-containing protein [Coriobacteriales bacterium]|nr:DivIVA domain-containing protein [Coriobacteriales bacterium]